MGGSAVVASQTREITPYLVPFSRYWRLKAENGWFYPPLPCLRPLLRGNPLEFRDETYPRKTRVMGLLYGKNCVILASTVFDWSTRVTDRQTDGRTDGIAMAYTRYSIYAVERKKWCIWFLVITSANVGRFSKFFHWQIRKEAPYVPVIKVSISPELR